MITQHSAAHVLVTQVEEGIAARLKAGLGKLVTEVAPYSGELDDLAKTVSRLPAAWVAFAGDQLAGEVGQKYKIQAEFVVMVGSSSARSGADQRQGGPKLGEVGINMLLFTVRRLLAGQTLGLGIGRLQFQRTETVFNGKVGMTPVALFGMHFRTVYTEHALDDGAWPEPVPGTASQLFSEYGGQLDQRAMLTSIAATYTVPPGVVPVAVDTISITREEA